jgi:mRNA-degrading endonuclease RelE of RelBE toxin-antitoxin system
MSANATGPIQLPQDPIPVRESHVVIHVPYEIAFNLKKLNEITAKVLGKLGCDGCHSGRILEYRVIRDFVVNPKTLEIQDILPGH